LRPQAAIIRSVRGSLGVFNLLDLIQLLAQNNSRGYLGIHHPSQGEGRFYLEDGKLTHASFAGVHDLAALRAVLHDERGSFEFVPHQLPTQKTITASLDNLLLQAVRSLSDAPRHEEKQTPRPDEVDVPRVLHKERLMSVELSTDERLVVDQINGQRSAGELAEVCGQPLGQVRDVLVRLAALGLLEVKKRPPRVARLVIGLSHDLVGLEAAVDTTIIKTWERQHGRRVKKIRIREESGREFVFPTVAAPNLGAYLLFSSNAMMRFTLHAGASVLVKPEK
jgi:Domain of unknown function (DUF4388)